MVALQRLVVSLSVVALGILVAGPASASSARLDPTFGQNGTVVFDHGGTLEHAGDLEEYAGQPRALALDSAGRILVGGGSGPKAVVVRLTPDGEVDSGFGDGGIVRLDDFSKSKPGYVPDPDQVAPRIVAILPRPDGSMLLVMRTFDFGQGEFGSSKDILVALTPDGSLDLSFVPGYGRFIGQSLNSMPRAAVWSTEGKILMGGADYLSTFNPKGHEQAGYVMRRNSDGSYDAGYGGPAIGQDGWSVGFVKFRSPGWPNRTAISSLIPLASGKVVAGGYQRFHPFLVKLDSTGRRIKAFGSRATPGSTTTLYGGKKCFCFSSGVVAQTPKKGFIQVGHATEPGDELQNLLMLKYGPGGRLDKRFGVRGISRHTFKPYLRINSVAVQSNGRILVSGSRGYLNTSHFLLARYLPNGKPDKTFFGDGVYETSIGPVSTADRIVLDGKGHGIVAGGSSENGSGHFVVKKFLLNG